MLLLNDLQWTWMFCVLLRKRIHVCQSCWIASSGTSLPTLVTRLCSRSLLVWPLLTCPVMPTSTIRLWLCSSIWTRWLLAWVAMPVSWWRTKWLPTRPVELMCPPWRYVHRWFAILEAFESGFSLHWACFLLRRKCLTSCLASLARMVETLLAWMPGRLLELSWLLPWSKQPLCSHLNEDTPSSIPLFHCHFKALSKASNPVMIISRMRKTLWELVQDLNGLYRTGIIVLGFPAQIDYALYSEDRTSKVIPSCHVKWLIYRSDVNYGDCVSSLPFSVCHFVIGSFFMKSILIIFFASLINKILQ